MGVVNNNNKINNEKEKIISGDFRPQDIGVRPFMRCRGETKSNN